MISGRVLVHPPRPGEWNMAVDHALARTLRPGEAVLRLYEWVRPTLSFGRNQRAVGAYDEAAIRRDGTDLVRRPTGGRAVLHDEELTYSVVLPLRAYGGLRDTYRLVNEGLVEALRAVGVPASLSGRTGPVPPPEAGACFAAPAEGEVVVAGRKLVGSAQARVEGVLLQHGSILLGGDQGRVSRWERGGDREDLERAVQRNPGGSPFITLSEVLTRIPGRDTLVSALTEGVTGVLGGAWEETTLTPREETLANELLQQYQSPGWTWRR